MPQSQPRPDPMYHWIPCMLRHDRKLLSREIAPTGEDYNAIFPAGVGLIWHQCEDAAELAAHVVNITANQGAIISVEPEGRATRSFSQSTAAVTGPCSATNPTPRKEWMVL
jgi:hypothetical protein